MPRRRDDDTSTLQRVLWEMVQRAPVEGGVEPGDLDPGTVRRLLGLAEFHSVIPLVRDRLRSSPGLPVEVRTDLDDASALATATHLRALADLDGVMRSLGDARVDAVVMKGPASAEFLWDRPEQREYTDLDILVPPADVGTALDALEESGHVLLERNWDMLLDRRRGQIHLRGTQGTLIDLHWDLIAEGPIRDEFRFDTDAMVARSSRRKIGRTPVRVLDDVDRMLHLGLHGCLSGGHRLIWLKELEAASLATGLDWDAVIAEGRRSRVAPLLGLMLRRVNDVLQPSPAPTDAVDALRPTASWRWLSEVADGRSPAVPLQDASLRKTIGRSTRPTARASWAELIRSGSSWATAKVRRAAPDDLTDSDHPGSMLHESGGDSGRRRYVAWVARQRAT